MGEHKRRAFAQPGVERRYITQGDNLIVLTRSDIEPVLDGIARDQETMRHGVNKLAARIPLFLYEQLQHAGIADDPDRFKAWLNSSEAAPWRVWKGSL